MKPLDIRRGIYPYLGKFEKRAPISGEARFLCAISRNTDDHHRLSPGGT